MFKIISKKDLSQTIKELEILAPDTARNAKAGHFVMIKVNAYGERVPFTIVSADKTKGTVKIVLQEVGKTTKMLGTLKAGNYIDTLLGPLGVPSKIESYGNVLCIGGGVGIAAIYPIAQALKGFGNRMISILGARSKDLLFLDKEMQKISDEYFVTTDDGSFGKKGFVTDVLKDILKAKKIDIVFVVGPIPMMKAVFDIIKPTKIPMRVSLGNLMLDGIGMCGACRFNYFGEVKFTCADGPEFDAYGVDFEDVANRQKAYKNKEAESLCEGNCRCEK